MPDGVNGTSTRHRWRFFRSGGVDQVRLDTGADLANLAQLNLKLWVALACPTRGLEFDSRTLDLIDGDKDGRVRAPEVLAAVAWVCAVHKDPGEILASPATLSAASINPETPEGRHALDSLRRVTADLGKTEGEAVTLDDVSVVANRLTQSPFNGDGVITPDACRAPHSRALVEDVIATVGPVNDRSGKPGVCQETVDRFFAGAQACADWWARRDADRERVMPLGNATPDAYAAFKAVKGKIDDYFARRRLAEFDLRSVAALNGQDADFLALSKAQMGLAAAEAAALPLARIEPGRDLPLAGGLNPAWAEPLARFNRLGVAPILGARTALSPDDWALLCERLAGHEAWEAARPTTPVGKLGLDRIHAILAGDGRAALAALIAEDLTHAADAEAIIEVERLIRYRRDLYTLLMSFVSFRDFYTHRQPALFQAGTLFLDGRSCDLCVRVENADKHAVLAAHSKICLVYCDCVRAAAGEKTVVAAAFMDGDSDNLIVGRNGVFYDRSGRDWDATITRVIDNPVSIRQAFWSPYKKVARFIDEQLAKRASADAAAVEGRLNTAAAASVTADKAGRAHEVKRMDVGTVAAIGVALGSIGTFVAAIFTKFVDLGVWLPVGVVVLMLAISLPSMILAWLKLRQRNLGPILDGTGWAVNTRASINVPFGRTMTKLAVLPRNADRSFIDPYAEKRKVWPLIVASLLAILAVLWALNRSGRLYEWFKIGTPAEHRSTSEPKADSPKADSATDSAKGSGK